MNKTLKILGIFIALIACVIFIASEVKGAYPPSDYKYNDDFKDESGGEFPDELWYIPYIEREDAGCYAYVVSGTPTYWKFYKPSSATKQIYHWNLTEDGTTKTSGVNMTYCNMNVNIPNDSDTAFIVRFRGETGTICGGLRWRPMESMWRLNSIGEWVQFNTYIEGTYMNWRMDFDYDKEKIYYYRNGVYVDSSIMVNNVKISSIEFNRWAGTGVVKVKNIDIGVNDTALYSGGGGGGCGFLWNFTTNWTLVGHPFIQNYMTASGWSNYIPHYFSVSRWDPVNQTYANYTGDPGDDFNLINGVGYFVGVTENSSQCLNTSTPIEHWNVTIYPGWNYLAWINATNTSAGNISNMFYGVDTVMYWNTTDQDFVAHLAGTPIHNFTVSQGMGFLIHTLFPQVWNESYIALLPLDKPVNPYPVNNSTILSPCCVNLSWDPCYIGVQEATYNVYFGTSNPPPKIADNITNNYLNVGCLSGNSYHWRVVAHYYNLSNSSDPWTFSCSAENFYYCTLIRNEEDFQPYNISDHTNYSYRLYAYFDNYTLQYNITYNGFNATTGEPEGINNTNCFTFNSQPNVLRLMVYTNDDNNFTYYRSRIPTLSSQSIIFWLPDNDTLMTRYIFTLDDRSGFYLPPDVWIRIYIYNETFDNTGFIHEDYFTVDSTLQAYLLYNHKYYNEIHKDNLVYQNNKYMDASDVTEQTIIIFPYIPAELSYWTDDLSISAYHDPDTDKLFFIYQDSLSDTDLVSYEIYEFYNGSDTRLFSGSFSSNVFLLSESVNVSRYHYLYVNISHWTLGSLNITINVFPYRPAVISPEEIEDLFNKYFFGENAIFSFFGIAIGAVIYAILLSLSEYFLHVGITISGLIIGGFQYYTGLSIFNSMIAALFIILGILLAIRKREVYP